MYIEIAGGLTSRLDVLSSIVCSEPYKNGEIQLIWEKEDGIISNFNDLFKNDIKFYPKPVDLSQYEIMRTPLPYPLAPHRYLIADHPLPIAEDNDNKVYDKNPNTKFSLFMKSLVPQDDIQDTIDGYSQLLKSDTIGINIRRGVGHNYHLNSCIFSPDELFHTYITNKLNENPNQTFLITTDSAYTLERLCMKFGDRLIFVKEYRNYPLDGGYSIQGMKRTVIDWFLLSKMKKIIMTKETGFAQRICRIYDIAYEELSSNNNGASLYYNTTVSNKAVGIFI